MGKEEYTTASRGTLKLKGAQDGRIGKPHKHKKKKRPKAENAVDDEQAGAAAGETAEQLKDHASGADETLLEEKKVASEEVDDAADGDVLKQAHEEASSGGIKTEAQLRHEAHRRRKVWYFCSCRLTGGAFDSLIVG